MNQSVAVMTDRRQPAAWAWLGVWHTVGTPQPVPVSDTWPRWSSGPSSELAELKAKLQCTVGSWGDLRAV